MTGSLAASAEPMAYRYNAPQSSADRRYVYFWPVLKEALERTVATDGPYLMEPADPMPQAREEAELQRDSGRITVIVRGASADFAKALTPVNIPVDKGILGYRLFLIRKERQPELARIMSLDELRHFSIGQDESWKDVPVLQANGLTVVTANRYEGLFPMLEAGRFDLFSRSVMEIGDELEQRKAAFPDLAIEQHLMIYYPNLRYFWFAPTESGRRLAARAAHGLEGMIADGTLDRMFQAYHAPLLSKLHLKDRLLFRLDNPYLPPGIPWSDKRIWFNPQMPLTQ